MTYRRALSFIRGRSTWQVLLTEVPESERPQTLREFPRQNQPGVRIFVSNGVVASGDPDSFAAAAPCCRVFRDDPEPEGHETPDGWLCRTSGPGYRRRCRSRGRRR